MAGQGKTPRWIVPALAGLVLLSLGLSLGGDFVWDDRPLIVENPLIKDVGRFDEILTRAFWESDDDHDRFRAFFRPVVIFSYTVDHAIWGLNPAGFHLTNLLLHFGCCVLVLRIASAERLEPPAAFAGAALFAVHPVHVESVAWISGRTDLLATILLLGAFHCHRGGHEASAGRRLASWLLFAAALFAKEMAATLPAIIFAAGWLGADGKRRVRRALVSSAPFFAILGLYLICRAVVLSGQGEPLYALEPTAWFATALFVAGRYLTLLVLPAGLDAHYPYRPLETVLDPRAVIGVLMLAIVLFAAWRLRRSRSPAVFWLFWAVVSWAPVFAFGHFGDVLMADRFAYFPSAGAAMLAAYGVQAVMRSERLKWRRATFATLGVLILVLASVTIARTRVWADDYRLFSSMRETSPHSALVHNNLGLALYHREDLPAATHHFRTAIELAPEYALAYNNLAAALHRNGEKQEALALYRQALEHAPDLMMAGANAGHLLVELGRNEEGLTLLRDAARRHPQAPPVLFALADASYLTGDFDSALGWLQQIDAVDPGYADSFYLRGKIHYQAERLHQAADEMSRFLERSDALGPRAEFARDVIRQARTRAAADS